MSALRAHRLYNALVSTALIGAIAGVLALVGYVLSGQAGAVLALIMACVFVAFAPRFRVQWLLRRSGARPLHVHEAPQVHHIVDALARDANVPRPALMLFPSPIPNALATGEGSERTLAVSIGLLQSLRLDELRAVLAHEISHLANGDTFVLRLVSTLQALTASMSRFGVWLAILQLPLVLLGAPALPWTAVLILVFAPMLSAALSLALSRSREYDADLGAVRLTGDPSALASALRKLEAMERTAFRWLPIQMPEVPSWLRTHPATEERIRRLQVVSQRPSRAKRERRRPVVVIDRPRGFSEL